MLFLYSTSCSLNFELHLQTTFDVWYTFVALHVIALLSGHCESVQKAGCMCQTHTSHHLTHANLHDIGMQLLPAMLLLVAP